MNVYEWALVKRQGRILDDPAPCLYERERAGMENDRKRHYGDEVLKAFIGMNSESDVRVSFFPDYEESRTFYAS